MSNDIVFSIGDKKCILDNEFKNTLMELIKVSNIDVEVLYDVLIVPHHISQKKYYNKIKNQSE